MSSFQALTYQTGNPTNLGANTLISGNGITSLSGNLSINAAGTNVVVGTALQFAANIGLTVASGSSAFDFSGGTGVFKSSSGAGRRIPVAASPARCRNRPMTPRSGPAGANAGSADETHRRLL